MTDIINQPVEQPAEQPAPEPTPSTDTMQTDVFEALKAFNEQVQPLRAAIAALDADFEALLEAKGILANYREAKAIREATEAALAKAETAHRPLISNAATRYLQATGNRPAIPDGMSWRKADVVTVEEAIAIRSCIERERVDLLKLDVAAFAEAYPAEVVVTPKLTVVISSKIKS